jgi:hypothetical protein
MRTDLGDEIARRLHYPLAGDMIQPSGGGRHEGVEDAANLADTVRQIAPLLDRG